MPCDPSQVYQPEADSYLLLDAACAEVRPSDRVIEVGTGSGFIASGIGLRAARIVATDINPHAAACSHAAGIEVIRTDLMAGVRGPFDLVLFNPPYLPTGPGERIDDWLEYALDGGLTGRDVIARFAADAGRILAPGGRILLLVSELTGIPETIVLFEPLGFSCRKVAEATTEGELLVVLKFFRP